MRLTVTEATVLENKLGLLKILSDPEISDEIKLKLLEFRSVPQDRTIYEKLKAELDQLEQSQTSEGFKGVLKDLFESQESAQRLQRTRDNS